MRKLTALLAVVAVTVLALVVLAPAASAHMTGPCDALDNDPGNSGYAEHHIVEFAHAGLLGQGHKPGTHMGFSICLSVHG